SSPRAPDLRVDAQYPATSVLHSCARSPRLLRNCMAKAEPTTKKAASRGAGTKKADASKKAAAKPASRAAPAKKAAPAKASEPAKKTALKREVAKQPAKPAKSATTKPATAKK